MSTAPAGSPLLQISGVSIAFGGLRALDAVSLDVPAGGIVGLIGPNGAGKTTLFNVVSGLLTPDEGQVSFRGEVITGRRADVRAQLGIGRSFQNLGLMVDETVRTNLLAAQHLAASYSTADLLLRPWRWWGAERRLEHRAVEALARFGLEDRMNERVGSLSFGAARFTELAAVLAPSPRLMLLDEPTTGLSMDETARLLLELRQVRADGTTILIVAHDVAFTMSLCDSVYVLAGGRLLAHGTPTEIQRDPTVVEAYLGRPA